MSNNEYIRVCEKQCAYFNSVDEPVIGASPWCSFDPDKINTFVGNICTHELSKPKCSDYSRFQTVTLMKPEGFDLFSQGIESSSFLKQYENILEKVREDGKLRKPLLP